MYVGRRPTGRGEREQMRARVRGDSSQCQACVFHEGERETERERERERERQRDRQRERGVFSDTNMSSALFISHSCVNSQMDSTQQPTLLPSAPPNPHPCLPSYLPAVSSCHKACVCGSGSGWVREGGREGGDCFCRVHTLCANQRNQRIKQGTHACIR